MLTFHIFRFRVTIQPFFWILAVLLGLSWVRRLDNPFVGMAMWVAVVFISVLWHELGHAFAFRRYKIESEIVLHGLGGYARPLVQPRLTRNQDIIVSAAGPAFQLAIGLPLYWLNQRAMLGPLVVDKPYADMVLMALMMVNTWWPLLNLLPVYPLDGGRISLGLCGPRNENTALWISFMCALGVALWAVAAGWRFMGLMFGMMAYNNWCRLTGRPEVPM